jgi:hypothetical protein
LQSFGFKVAERRKPSDGFIIGIGPPDTTDTGLIIFTMRAFLVLKMHGTRSSLLG